MRIANTPETSLFQLERESAQNSFGDNENPLPPSLPPQLTPPAKMMVLRFLDSTEETRNLGSSLLDQLTGRLNAVKGNIQEISAHNMEKLKEAAARANTSGFWSILKKISACLLSALSTITGIAFLAAGGGALIGGAMIASGILTIANFALAETGKWDWAAKMIAGDNEEKQKKWATFLPSAVGIVAGAIGLFGSVGSYASHAISFADKAILVAQSAFALFEGAVVFGKGCADARLISTQADLADIGGQLTSKRTEFDSLSREIEVSLNDFRMVKSKARQAMKTIAQTNMSSARA